MRQMTSNCGRRAAVAFLLMMACAGSASAQATAAGGSTRPDDTPTIHVGVVMFGNYEYQIEPRIVDADGNVVNRSAFDITRAYLNVTGTISHLVAFRLTPDVFRDTNVDRTVSDSLRFRLKYAYLQANFDDWLTAKSY